MYPKSFEVNLRVYYKGKFDFVKGRIEYVEGAVNLSCGLSSSTINMKFLRDVALKLMGIECEIWYKAHGLTLTLGKRMFVSEYDVVNLLKSRDKYGIVCVYLIQPIPFPSPSIQHSPRTNVVQMRLLSNSMPTSQTTLRRSPRNKVIQYAEKTIVPSTITTSVSPPIQKQPLDVPSNSLKWREKLPIKRQLSFVDNCGNQLTNKEKTREKRKIQSEEFYEHDDFNDTDSNGNDNNISDIEWQVGEENFNDGDELFDDNNRSRLVDNVEESLGVVRPSGETKAKQAHIWGVDDLEVDVNAEQEYDSDDLRSLQGSDNEVDPYHTFNADIEFKKPVHLSQGLKFANVQLFRKALISHSVENGYDFYYCHNGSAKVSAYCKYRCKCPWNPKRSRLGKCNCVKKNECGFRVYGVKLDGQETFQIRTLNLKHSCPMSRYNRKVSSEYLAEKFLEFWRTNIDWKLKNFRDHVLKELNVHVSYGKCWLARSRAKLIIYGNGKEQYAKIWDYAAAIRKYNHGSSAFVLCDNIERPPPYFKRIYICLEACKVGFTKGCRPILGVDGCHLKGAYPGMCLVALAKDGNNNIYPVAWAVVEVENADTWRWFIELLSSDIGREDGEGMTFMSDRQKGLIDALKYMVPKVEIRFCVRHIWANFKLSFGGQVFKDAFWMAARASTKAAFDSHMEEIKSLSNEAWTYLNDIPTKHWSRHAFGTTSKSNMLLNNLCETFNAVLKDARDKPILTHMEWMRRYVMKRNCGKREGVVKYEGRLMPYAEKYIKWAGDESRYAVVSSANEDKYEVDLKGETWRVNLKEHTCDCNHWNLTGLPCPHAMGVILYQRLAPENFVDETYTKMRYMMAYDPVVSPMPGVHEWEKTNMPEPLPPLLRKMSGRPSAKKRRREAGEEQSKYVKRPKRSNKCSHCGHAGHSKRTCKNPPTPPKPTNVGGRPESTSEWAKEGRLKAAKRKEEREKYASAHLTSSTSQATSSTIHNPYTEMSSQANVTIPSWARE